MRFFLIILALALSACASAPRQLDTLPVEEVTRSWDCYPVPQPRNDEPMVVEFERGSAFCYPTLEV